MQATDGMTQAIHCLNIEARGRAFDLDAKVRLMVMPASVAKQSYDRCGLRMRWVVQFMNIKLSSMLQGEIAMNLDNAANSTLSSAINRVPAVKPFLLFTKTPINMMGFAASHRS